MRRPYWLLSFEDPTANSEVSLRELSCEALALSVALQAPLAGPHDNCSPRLGATAPHHHQGA